MNTIYMMTPQQTAKTYDLIAEHWDNPSFDYRNGIGQHQRALQFAPAGGDALDVGCGSNGRIITLLQNHGFHVEGLDISVEMLNRAKKHHPEVLFYGADICEWTLPKTYHFISAWDSVWHVPLSQQLSVIKKLFAGLTKNGVFIFTSGGVDAPDEVTNPCFGQPLYHAAPGIPQLLNTIEISGCCCRHLEYDGKAGDKHIYIIAQRVS
ncbi:MAG: class I SAM-dependent DNA methyltransferase [Methylophilaceae bacterium]